MTMKEQMREIEFTENTNNTEIVMGGDMAW